MANFALIFNAVTMEKRSIEPKVFSTMRLVKSEDLNHHGTLFAGRSAEWFVESGLLLRHRLLGHKAFVLANTRLYFSQLHVPAIFLHSHQKLFTPAGAA
jgi:hypothetical protein